MYRPSGGDAVLITYLFDSFDFIGITVGGYVFEPFVGGGPAGGSRRGEALHVFKIRAAFEHARVANIGQCCDAKLSAQAPRNAAVHRRKRSGDVTSGAMALARRNSR